MRMASPLEFQNPLADLSSQYKTHYCAKRHRAHNQPSSPAGLIIMVWRFDWRAHEAVRQELERFRAIFKEV